MHSSKTHVRDVGSHLRSLNILPGCFQIKEKAAQQMMMFLNTKEGTCVTHFDRDSSALYVVAGLKTVMVAPPMPEQDRPPDGLLHDIDPFSRDLKRHGKQQDGSVMKWGRIDLAPGDGTYSVQPLPLLSNDKCQTQRCTIQSFIFLNSGYIASGALAIPILLPFPSRWSSQLLEMQPRRCGNPRRFCR